MSCSRPLMGSPSRGVGPRGHASCTVVYDGVMGILKGAYALHRILHILHIMHISSRAYPVVDPGSEVQITSSGGSDQLSQL